jgi:glycosyltransferase involved in cell wall biosynthesis
MNQPSEHSSPIELSIIVPAFNEAESLPHCIREVSQQCARLGCSYEILVIDDGSHDESQIILASLAEQHRQLSYRIFSRNFGKEAAIQAGLMLSKGAAAIIMDADLQHPPLLIPSLYKCWKEDVQIVHAIKRERNTSYFYSAFAETFNYLMSCSLNKSFRGASDYKLLDREVINAIISCKENNRFFRGLVAWVGFRECSIEFDVEKRLFGKSTWNTYGLIKYSLKNLITFSSLPLRIIAALGFITTLLGIALALYTLSVYVLGYSLSGFTTVIIAITFFSGVNLLAMGVMAIYIGLLFDEQKRRPHFIINNIETTRNRAEISPKSII